MSLTGSGRFRSVYVDDFDDRRSSFSSSGKSGVFNPNNFGANNNDGVISYEPGTGAEYMYSKGWHQRDPYGKPLPTINRASTRMNGVKFEAAQNNGLFDRENR